MTKVPTSGRRVKGKNLLSWGANSSFKISPVLKTDANSSMSRVISLGGICIN